MSKLSHTCLLADLLLADYCIHMKALIYTGIAVGGVIGGLIGAKIDGELGA